MQAQNQIEAPPGTAELITSLGELLGTSECDIVECIEALTCVLGDAIAQTTRRKFSKTALAASMMFVTEAYALGCTPDDSNSTTH